MRKKNKKKIFTFIKKNKIKSILTLFAALGILAFIAAWAAVSGGHDKQNKVILFLKESYLHQFTKKLEILFLLFHI